MSEEPREEMVPGNDEAAASVQTHEADAEEPVDSEEVSTETPTPDEAPPVMLPVTATAPPRDPREDEEPTYILENWSGLDKYTCLLDGHEDWSLETLTQHMAVYHQGIMREAPAGPGPEAAAPEAMGAEDGPEGQAQETEAAEPGAAAETAAEGG